MNKKTFTGRATVYFFGQIIFFRFVAGFSRSSSISSAGRRCGLFLFDGSRPTFEPKVVTAGAISLLWASLFVAGFVRGFARTATVLSICTRAMIILLRLKTKIL
uniref:Uncharacterized protein n=1 Tax=Romanomermis culicivorax TaxID=13658 RepID=A0A915HIG1_ROMCU